MKTLLRTYIFELLTLWIVQIIFGESFQIKGGWEIFLLIGFILAVFELTLKPILKLIFFPINLASMGLFSIFLTAGSIFAVAYFMPDLHISSYTIGGFELLNFRLLTQDLGYIGTLVAITLVMILVNKFLHYLSN